MINDQVKTERPEIQLDGQAEIKKISPILLAWVSLPVIFMIYQGFGAVLVFFLGSPDLSTAVNGTRISQGLAQLFFLILPVYLLVRLHTRQVAGYTFFSTAGMPFSAWFLIPVSVLAIQPLIQSIGYAERQIPWPDQMIAFRDQMEEMMKILVQADGLPELLLIVIVVSVIPAFAEEFYFRGYLLRNFSRQHKPVVTVILTGSLFGLFHFNPFQITGLILLGIYFSFLVWYFQSLWAGIIAHFTNNFLAVMVYYISSQIDLGVPLDDPDYAFPFSAVLVSLVLFGLILQGILNSGKLTKPSGG
ncbi:MAG: CPBP family intramembrane metalloprotease [Bacteroidetes bacterium]|nr:CPBP family intramembrane metalloprotease [Bacteroidota bacterium]